MEARANVYRCPIAAGFLSFLGEDVDRGVTVDDSRHDGRLNVDRPLKSSLALGGYPDTIGRSASCSVTRASFLKVCRPLSRPTCREPSTSTPLSTSSPRNERKPAAIGHRETFAPAATTNSSLLRRKSSSRTRLRFIATRSLSSLFSAIKIFLATPAFRASDQFESEASHKAYSPKGFFPFWLHPPRKS